MSFLSSLVPRRVPMFFKFLVGCMLLAGLLIIGGSVIFHELTRMESRGNYLDKHFKRYLEYQEGLGRALVSVTDLIASGPSLRAAMAGQAPRPSQTSQGAPQTPQARGGTSAAELAAASFEVLRRDNAVMPDFGLLFDARGNHVWSENLADPDGGFKPQELGEMEVVTRVARGATLLDMVLVHRDRAYQIAGVPIRAPDGGDDIVGGLILGTAIERYLRDYMRQSDKRVNMQHRLSLIHDGKVVASAMPRALWSEVGTVLTTDDRGYVIDRGNNYKQWVVTLSQGDEESSTLAGDYDVYGPDHPQDRESSMAKLQGFSGLEAGKVGNLYLMRSRANLKGRGSRIPWRDVVIGVVLSIVVAFLLAVWITRPIKDFVAQSRKILTGETDLTQRIEIRSRDETQALAHNINKAFERLYRLASEVQGAAFHVGASSAQLSAASKQMLGGLKDQTEKIEGSTAAVTELSASIQQVAANAAEATNVAEKSNVAVTSAVARMEQIRGAVEDAAGKMHDLGESSKRIGNIVEVIRQISEQTSLLALNASIEAAHAGEQGRGFAVVADEVSSLARRVGQSAKDIETLIQTIKEQTTEAMSSMQIGTGEVEQGTRLVTDTLTDLRNLIDVVKDTAAAVQEQAVVSDEIARNMDAVQSIAAEVLSGSEESVVQAEQLHELAFALEQSVNGFNLDAGAASGAPEEPPTHALPGRPATRRLPAAPKP